jgi:hypothetical protein
MVIKGVEIIPARKQPEFVLLKVSTILGDIEVAVHELGKVSIRNHEPENDRLMVIKPDDERYINMETDDE